MEDDPECYVAKVPPGIQNVDRLFELVINPLSRMIETSGLNRKSFSQGGLYFSLPQRDDFFSTVNLKREFLGKLKERLALPASKEFGGVITGSTGVFSLIEKASEKLLNGDLIIYDYVV